MVLLQRMEINFEPGIQLQDRNSAFGVGTGYEYVVLHQYIGG